MDTSLEPSNDMWAVLSVFWCKYLLECERERSDNGGISSRWSFTTQEGLGSEVAVQMAQAGQKSLLTFSNSSFIIWHSTEGWEGPGSGGWGDTVFSKSNPL